MIESRMIHGSIMSMSEGSIIQFTYDTRHVHVQMELYNRIDFDTIVNPIMMETCLLLT